MTDQLFTDEELEQPFGEDEDAGPAGPYNGPAPHVPARALPDIHIRARWQVRGRDRFSPDARTIYQGLGLGTLGLTLMAKKATDPKLPAMLDAWLTQAYEEYDMTDQAEARNDLHAQMVAKVARYQSLLEPLLSEAEREALGPIPNGKNVSWFYDGDSVKTAGQIQSSTALEDDTFVYQVIPDGEADPVELAGEYLTVEDDDESNAHLFASADETAPTETQEPLFSDEPEPAAADAVVEGEATFSDEPEPVVESMPNPGKGKTPPAKAAFTQTTNVKYDPKAEPQAVDQYTLNVHLVINPKQNGKRIVAINISSHGLTPVMHAGEVGAKLWAELPGMIAAYQAGLPAHAAEKGQPKPATPARTPGRPAPKPEPKAKTGKPVKTVKATPAKPAPPQFFT